MGDTNRVQLSYVRETLLGTTPGSPALKECRYTGETLANNINSLTSDEIRSDRMVPDHIPVGAQNAGDINFELSYPLDRTFFSDFLEMALFSSWVNSAQRANLLNTTDEITNVTAASGTVTVSNGAVFAANDIVLTTGFTNAANNFTKVATGGSATTAVFGAGAGMVNETPPKGARIKKVGVQGASGDIVAVANGLTSTTLNFTTIGLQVGGWIKIGGTQTAEKFATAANNGFARVTSIAAGAVGLDNLPVGWSADAGAGKTIHLYVPDYLANGTTMSGVTIQKGFLDMAVPSYFVFPGVTVAGFTLAMQAQQKITGTFSLMGIGHSSGTVALGTVETASSEAIMSASSNVGRLAEAGAIIGTPNFIRDLSFNSQNNLREKTAVASMNPVGLGGGRHDMMGNMTAYFGDLSLYTKYINSSDTNVNFRLGSGNRYLIGTIPLMEYKGGRVIADRGNSDVVSALSFGAKRDPVTATQFSLCRFDYAAA